MASHPRNDEEDAWTIRGGKRSWGDVEETENKQAIRRARSEEEEEPCTKMARLPVSADSSTPSSSSSWPCLVSPPLVAAASKRAFALREPHAKKLLHTFMMNSSVITTSGTMEAREESPPSQSLPYAPSLKEYCAPGGTSRFLPKPEWITPRRQRNSRSNEPGLCKTHKVTDVATGEGVPDAPPLPLPVDTRENGNEAPSDGLLPDHLFGAWSSPRQREQSRSGIVSPARDGAAAAAETNVDAFPPSGVFTNSKVNAIAYARQRERSPEAHVTRAEFGKDKDTALHVAIREGATEAALDLLDKGTLVDAENNKGVTPLILASQKGNLDVVQALLDRRASPLEASRTGCTPLLQASHFGHGNVVNLLLRHGARIEFANNKNTTALMRASQEGHSHIVETLLRHGAQANRRNNEQMSALMLASQRGHASVVKQLVDAEADLDVKTPQNSTALMLACKRGHMDVVKVLVVSGCELQHRDARGRTARDMAQRKNHKELVDLLTPTMQVELMRRESRCERSHVMIQLWQLLQKERALVKHPVEDIAITIHQLYDHPKRLQVLSCMPKTVSLLVQAMMLPAPLLQNIAAFLPLPRMWDRRIGLITRRCGVDADSSVSCTMDLIDEILEEGGFVEACDVAGVTPPTNFANWKEWKSWGKRCDVKHKASSEDLTASYGYQASATGSTLPALLPSDPVSSSSTCSSSTHHLPNSHTNPQQGESANVSNSEPLRRLSSVQMRREVCFLQLLAYRSPMLARTLALPPYNMSPVLLQQLKNINDIQSLVRRMGSKGVHFEASVAIELVLLAGTLANWYHRERAEC